MASHLQEFCLRWNNHHNTLVTVLDKLLERETFVDVILAAEGQFIKVHRIVLCACSQYFEDLLSQQTDKQSIIFLKDVTYIDLKSIVDYMYRGEVNVTQDQLASFLHTTEALKIKGLADKEKRGPPTQPDNSIASKVKKAAENHRAPSSPPSLLPIIASTSTVEEIEEVPEAQEMPPTSLPVIASTSTIEEMEEMPDEKEIDQATTPVPTSTIDVSQTLHMDADDHFIALDPKVEDVEEIIDISAEHLEDGDDSVWDNKEGEEDWSNSEGLSVSSAADQSNTMQNQSIDQEDDGSCAGPSTSKPKGGQGAPSKGKSGIFTCHQCGRSYRYMQGLNRHQTSTACGKLQLECPHCPFKCRRAIEMEAHVDCHSEGGGTYKCQICSYITKIKRSFRRHVARHNPTAK